MTQIRKRFEALMQDAYEMSRKKLNMRAYDNDHKRMFREGYKMALVSMGIITDSTTELDDESIVLMSNHLAMHIGDVPPLPNTPS